MLHMHAHQLMCVLMAIKELFGSCSGNANGRGKDYSRNFTLGSLIPFIVDCTSCNGNEYQIELNVWGEIAGLIRSWGRNQLRGQRGCLVVESWEDAEPVSHYGGRGIGFLLAGI